MKKSFIIIVSFIFAIVSLNAQDPAVKDSIKFDKITHDYGNIEQSSNGECSFAFTAKGNNAIALSSVNATCGCTSPEWTKNPVKPGESGIIKVKYNTQIIGRFTKTISVHSNAANSPVILTIMGTVLPPK